MDAVPSSRPRCASACLDSHTTGALPGLEVLRMRKEALLLVPALAAFVSLLVVARSGAG
jgi:hypothetical protein